MNMTHTRFVPIPSTHDGGLWVDEQIWGHRLHDEQTPWLIFLEFLTILLHHRDAPLTGHKQASDTVRYLAQQQMRLRHILFNSPEIRDLAARVGMSSAEAWRIWREGMTGKRGLDADMGAHLATLQLRIPDFKQFARIVEFLRRTSVEGLAGKRWTSRFVYPFGPAALYEDLREQGDTYSTDRLFFARTGELLYLMLCRSKHSEVLGRKLVEVLFSNDDVGEQLVELLQGDTGGGHRATRESGTLPYDHLPVFDRLAEDLLRLIDRGLPSLDIIPHFVNIATLHMLRYFLEQSSVILAEAAPAFIFELNVSKRSPMRDASTNAYDRNNELPSRAVAQLVREVAATEEWCTAAASDSPRDGAIETLQRKFGWPSESRRAELPANTTSDDLISELIDDALTRHKRHVGRIHGSWARAIGLASRRGSRRYRYAPTDRLLKTLVLATVDSRMELKTFLDLLYQRYGIVVIRPEGELVDPDLELADTAAYNDNLRRLEERLTSLGLAERLSDSCAYVRHSTKEDA